MVAIFIDGPMRSETRTIPTPLRIYKFPIPQVSTTCFCDDEFGDTSVTEPREFLYYLAALGPEVAIYSKHQKPEALIHSLRYWVETDISAPLAYDCRNPRAWE